MKKKLLDTIYRFGGFAPFSWANRDKILILTYHRFGKEQHPHKISAAEFKAHLEYLRKNQNVLSLNEVVKCLQDGKQTPPKTVVITIDDGYRDAYEIAFPLLKKYDMPAVIYAVTDFLDGKCWLWTDLMRYILRRTDKNKIEIAFENDRIEEPLRGDLQRLEIAASVNSHLKKMPDNLKKEKIAEIAAMLEVEIPEQPVAEFAPFNWEQAREMEAENVCVESHTVSHPILKNIAAGELDFELKNSKKRLEQMLEREVEHFCYPNGSLNKTVENAVKNADYKSAVTTVYGFNNKNADDFLLKRIGAPKEIAAFAQTVSGFEAFRLRM